jgi:phage-related protein
MNEKPLIWLKGEIKTPPFSKTARLDVGFLLGLLQRGHKISMPKSRPMPSIGPACHELRIDDNGTAQIWRIIYKIDEEAIIIGDVFSKKTNSTPKTVIHNAKSRFRKFDILKEKI